ncbi:MAG: RNB domain-containing ribonuclease [Desulfocapsaceae bacterium]|nr:RNB domain-containing ribonuclease [Desulfocapsaceae bacterium]
MVTSGKIIEYLENGKFVCAFVTECQNKRTRSLNQNGREINLPFSRIVHCSTNTYPASLNREDLIRTLKATNDTRISLMQKINLEEIWELASEEKSDSFEPVFLAGLVFSGEASDDMVSAFLRCVFTDHLYFKFKEGLIRANSPEQMEHLRRQLEQEEKKRSLITNGVQSLTLLKDSANVVLSQDLRECLNLVRDYYLFGTDAEHADLAVQILKEAGLHRPHEPYHLLVKAGIWNKNENIPLLRQGLPVGFSLPARQQAEGLLQTNVETLLQDPVRVDLSNLAPITIDGGTTLDFDDALTIEEQEGNYLVGIHISDVAHYVRPGSPLFLEAMSRGTSIYFPEGQIPMLPRHLSQGICSLIQGELRATMSFMILLSPEAEVLRVRISPSIIRVARRLTYEEADEQMQSDPQLRILDMLRQKLRRRRVEAGALLLPFPDVNIFVDGGGKVHVSLNPSDTPARTLVSEMMILANSEAARFVADRMAPGLFRAQGPPKQRLITGDDNDLYLNTRQRKQISRGELLSQAKEHSGLGVGQYTTVTSPIRRLLDLVMQHQLHSLIRRQPFCFSEEMCKDFIAVITRTLSQANSVKQQRHRYWLLKYLEDRKGQYLDALVIESGPKRVGLLLTDILMDVDLPAQPGKRPPADTLVKIKVAKVDALDNIIAMEW